jgi:hypothetical protein
VVEDGEQHADIRSEAVPEIGLPKKVRHLKISTLGE